MVQALVLSYLVYQSLIVCNGCDLPAAEELECFYGCEIS